MKDSDTKNTPDTPRINEDRSTTKTHKEILEKAQKRSFRDEVENDINKSQVYMSRASEAKEKLGKEHEITKQEKASSDVYKRSLILLASGNAQIKYGDKEDDIKLASENKLPASVYQLHGGRTNVRFAEDVSPEDTKKLMNWLASGNADSKEQTWSEKQSQQGAIKEGKIVYARSAATHGVDVKEIKENSSTNPYSGQEQPNKAQYEYTEKQGFMVGAKSFAENKILGKDTKHFGVDLAMDAEYGKNDSEGKKLDRPDGDHGHLYFHYSPGKEQKDGSKSSKTPGYMLIGIEGAAPSSPKHSKLGTPDPLSPTMGVKFGALEEKRSRAQEEEYKNVVLPKGNGAVVITLDKNMINEITKLNADDFNHNLAKVMPASSPEEFKHNYKNKNFYQLPEKIPERPRSSIPINNQETQQKESGLKNQLNELKSGLANNISKPITRANDKLQNQIIDPATDKIKSARRDVHTAATNTKNSIEYTLNKEGQKLKNNVSTVKSNHVDPVVERIDNNVQNLKHLAKPVTEPIKNTKNKFKTELSSIKNSVENKVINPSLGEIKDKASKIETKTSDEFASIKKEVKGAIRHEKEKVSNVNITSISDIKPIKKLSTKAAKSAKKAVKKTVLAKARKHNPGAERS